MDAVVPIEDLVDSIDPICSRYVLSQNDLPEGVTCDGPLSIEYHAGTVGEPIPAAPSIEDNILNCAEVSWFSLNQGSMEATSLCSKVFDTLHCKTGNCRCIATVVHCQDSQAAAVVRRCFVSIGGLSALREIPKEYGQSAVMKRCWKRADYTNTMDRHADFLAGLFQSMFVPTQNLSEKGWKLQSRGTDAPSELWPICPLGLGYFCDQQNEILLFYNGVLKEPDLEGFKSPPRKKAKKAGRDYGIVGFPARKSHADGLKERVFNNLVLQTLLRMRSNQNRAAYIMACGTKHRPHDRYWEPTNAHSPIPKTDIWRDEFVKYSACKIPGSTFNANTQALRDGLRAIPANRLLFASPDDCMHANANIGGIGSHGRIRVLKGTNAFKVGGVWCKHSHDIHAFCLDTGIRSENTVGHTLPFLENIRHGFIGDHGCNARENNLDSIHWGSVPGCPEIWMETSDPGVSNGIFQFVPDGCCEDANRVFKDDLLASWVKAGLLHSCHKKVVVSASVLKLQCKFAGKISASGHCGNIERKLGLQVPQLEFGMEDLKALTDTEHDCAFICIIPLDPEGCITNLHIKQPLHCSTDDSIFAIIPYKCYMMVPATVFHSHGMNNALAGNTILQLQVFFTSNTTGECPPRNHSFHYKTDEPDTVHVSHGIISLRPDHSDIQRLGESNVQMSNQDFATDCVLDILSKLLLF